jgi:pimeloyl-ACP methyl ester carboxylesterase
LGVSWPAQNAKISPNLEIIMKLNVHTAGDGDRTALLIHGAMADHRTWQAIEARLLDLGYRIIAPDLRGHGHSPHGSYTAQEWADDLVESVPTGADLAIGHSLGGLALSLAVDQLRPSRAVYSDPAFLVPVMPPEVTAGLAGFAGAATAQSIREANPRWSDADIAMELEGFGLFDRGIVAGLASLGGVDNLPKKAVVPSLVQIADPSTLVDDATARLLRERGFELRVVPGTGHCIHRDDVDGFMASLDGWL